MLDRSRLHDDIKNSPVIIHPGRYAYLQSKTIPNSTNVFMITKDKDEVTVVVTETDIASITHDSETKWYSLIEIQTASPFMVPGFIAAITTAIAELGLTVLVISTYSKDYFLVHDHELTKVISALREIGFEI